MALADGESRIACKGKIFEKNNMVSYDSKLLFLAAALDGGSRGTAAVFFIQIIFY